MSSPAKKTTLFAFPWKDTDPLLCAASVARKPFALFFDSADREHPLSRYSFLCWDPFETLIAKDGVVSVRNRDMAHTFPGNPFDVLAERLEMWGMDRPRDPALPPFQGGAAGYFGYDLARQLEKLPAIAKDRPGLPDMAIGLYDQVLAFDHEKNTACLIVHAEGNKTARARKKEVEALFAHPPKIAGFAPASLDWTADRSEDSYRKDIEKVISYIHAGDIFQANLSRRFEAKLPEGFDSFSHYTHMREINAAPFSAYMNFGPVVLASTSPERFLSVRDRAVETRPIKGTRRRGANQAEDGAIAAELSSSEKDRAENAMIVDLLRNDLSKACEDHSVEVPQLHGLESFPGVHHLVSIVRGTLRANHTPVDLLKACFPGGSVTGAPKVRAMEIIEELEPVTRGPYCGAMGYIGFDGSMDTSIAIRTLVYTDTTAYLQTGGGIVADSVAEDELQETLAKAEKIFESFGTEAAAGRRRA